MKKTLLLALIFLNSCQYQTDLKLISDNLVSSNSVNNWYEKLSPELKSYYKLAEGKKGEDLFLALNKIVNQAEVLDYGEATSYLYTVVERVTKGKNNYIRAAYSNKLILGDGSSGHKYKENGDENKDGKKGDSINCEHTWPQNYFNKKGLMRTDLHHLFPTLSNPNSKRGNNPFGIAQSRKVTYSTASGSKLVNIGNGKYVFEPDNIQKGNTARATMYFYLRYYDKNIRSGEYNSATFFTNKVSLFNNWSLTDPVDSLEIKRNNLIFKKQGNRNPFIDIPNLIKIIGTDTFINQEKSFR